MARRPGKHTRAARPLSPSSTAAIETSSLTGERWVVRSVPGAAASKRYRCPGCSQVIPPAVPHLVVWPVEPGLTGGGGVEDRRHWHTPCWRRQV
ncbi:MAG: hypothetical protein ACLGIF_07930 [Actinomycetes bacterium]